MNPEIKFIETKSWSKVEWLKFRDQGLGGSEISTIFGLNPYKSKLQLHLEKSGQWPNETPDNFYMYRGKTTEDLIVEAYWKLYTDSPESVLINAANPEFEKKKCDNFEGYFVNPQFPHLFASPDRIMPIGHIHRGTGEVLSTESILEVKNTRSQETAKYESGISPAFMAQTQHYMLVLDLKYAEIILLKDSTFPEVVYFERSDEFCEAIVEQSKLFWDNVLRARELMAMPQTPDVQQELVMLEPSAEGGEAYLDFIKDRYKDQEKGITAVGADEQYGWAVEMAKATAEKKRLRLKSYYMGIRSRTSCFREDLSNWTSLTMNF